MMGLTIEESFRQRYPQVIELVRSQLRAAENSLAELPQHEKRYPTECANDRAMYEQQIPEYRRFLDEFGA